MFLFDEECSTIIIIIDEGYNQNIINSNKNKVKIGTETDTLSEILLTMKAKEPIEIKLRNLTSSIHIPI
jgi:hypothetical protein